MSEAPALSARDVRVTLGGVEILHDVQISVAPGEVVALMGGNGSGKSTFVRALVGALPLSSGSIEMFGHAPSPADRANLGYVPQRVTASAGVSATAREVVMSGLLGAGRLRPVRDARERAERALTDLGIGALARRDVGTLSGGEQQRVLIARAMVRDPRLVILDEPMAGVDLPSQESLTAALADRKERGAAIVIVLHELGALTRLIDHAVVLERGCVVHVGEPPAALGVHALPGHDHVHPHPDPPERASGPLPMDVTP